MVSMSILPILLLQASSGVAAFSHPATASEDSTTYRAVCDRRSIAVRYGNSETRRGAVVSLQVDGREVPDAVRVLNQVVGDRDIEQIAFMSCSGSGDAFKVKAVIRSGKSASVRSGSTESTFFSFTPSSTEVEAG